MINTMTPTKDIAAADMKKPLNLSSRAFTENKVAYFNWLRENEPVHKGKLMSVMGAYFLTRAVARGLIAAKKPGSLINITSQMGQVGGIDRAVYCGTKFAVEGFTKAMAIEWGAQGIRVNTICPTFIKTPLTEVTFANPERVKWIKEKIKLGRIGEVTDIMGPVVYLASDASALMTGTHMLIDGGWTAD